jgi:hypothetical protein
MTCFGAIVVAAGNSFSPEAGFMGVAQTVGWFDSARKSHEIATVKRST